MGTHHAQLSDGNHAVQPASLRQRLCDIYREALQRNESPSTEG